MNKTLIALAIAAALPVAAQADATISGTLNSKYTNAGVIDTDATLSIASSEVLANGMTATATFGILADTDDDTENAGTASLAGDFGTLTVGSIDADAAFQSGDIAGVVANTTESTSSTSSSVYGIHYAGTVAGLSVAAQVNAGTNAAKVAETVLKSTQIGATYDLNGLTVGYSYASGAADAFSTSGHYANAADKAADKRTANDGIDESQSAFGVSYAFGDLVVTAGKASLADDARVSATYTTTVEGLTIVAQLDNEPSGDYQIDLSYALSDAFTLSSEIDSTDGKDTTLVASYTAGDMTASVSKTDDGTTDASVGLSFGNAGLTLARNGGDEETSVSYKVAF
jgi:hypothetical protein